MNGEDAIRRAYAAILGHDFELAIAWFEQAIALDPTCAAYHYKLSITYARSNKWAKAIAHAKEAVRLAPEDEHYLLHFQHLQAKELMMQAEQLFDESDERLWLAIALLNQAVELDPLSLEAFLLMGIAYFRLGEVHLAIRALKELLKLDPEHSIGKRLLSVYETKWQQYLQLEHENIQGLEGRER